MENEMNNEIPIYYLRPQVIDPATKKSADKKGSSRIACIALAEDEKGNIARGISICSNCGYPDGRGGDNFLKSEARKRAIRRCRHALKTHKNEFPIGIPIKTGSSSKDDVIRHAGIVFLQTWSDRFGYDNKIPVFKASFNPNLTDFEKHIMWVWKERKAGVSKPTKNSLFARFILGIVQGITRSKAAANRMRQSN